MLWMELVLSKNTQRCDLLPSIQFYVPFWGQILKARSHNSFIFNELNEKASPAFAPYKAFLSLLTSTLVHKNSKLSRFLAFLSLSTSTQFLEHRPTDDGITDNIPGLIDFGTNTGSIN